MTTHAATSSLHGATELVNITLLSRSKVSCFEHVAFGIWGS